MLVGEGDSMSNTLTNGHTTANSSSFEMDPMPPLGPSVPNGAAGARASVLSRHDTTRKILLVCGVLSSALYLAADVFAWQRYPGYSPVSQVFSELLAAGAPTRPLMVTLVGVPYNLLVVALGLGVWLSPIHARAARIIGVLLVLYAIFSFAGGTFFNMDMRGSEPSPQGAVHPVATALMSVCILYTVGVGATLHGLTFRLYSIATLVTLVVFGVLAGLEAPHLAANEPTPWVGLIERVNIYAWMLWVAVLAMSLWAVQNRIPSFAATRRSRSVPR
jgi:Protein of unknown function (DUF998)